MRILIIIMVALNIVGCKETHCPAFPTNLEEYFPYTNEDRIKFKNLMNDTLVLNITNNWVSDSYSFDWNCKCACEADAGFITEIEDSFLVKIEGNMTIHNESTAIIRCIISDGKISNDKFSYRVEGINPFLEESTDLFGDTIVLKNEEINRFNDVLIVKSKGIVEFWDKKQNCKWGLVE